jgi:hypothetical protein
MRLPGQLETLDLRKEREKFRDTLWRAGFGLCPTVAAVDLSYNEDAEGQWGAHWQGQWYAILQTRDSPSAVSAAFSRFFMPGEMIPRPVRTRAVTEIIPAVSYVVKPYYARRVGYIDGNGRRNTRTCALKPPQLQELSELLDQYSFNDLLLLHRLRRNGCRIVNHASRTRKNDSAP